MSRISKIALWTGLTALFSPLAPAQEDLFQKARQLQLEGRENAALEAYTEYKQAHPRELEAYLESARLMIDLGRTHDAEIELSEALRIGADGAGEAFRLADLLNQLENPVPASQVLDPYLASGVLSGEALWLLVDLYYQQRRFDDALRVLRLYAQRAGADRKEIHLEEGKILLEKGELEDSMVAFETVARQDPKSAEAFHGLSKVCFFGNNLDAALEMSSRAVELAPSDPLYIHQLGAVQKALGNTQEAIATLEKARDLGADVFSISFELGDLYRKQGRIEQAREALRTYQGLLAEKLESQERTQLINQGEKELEGQKLDAARQAFEKVLETDPDNWTAHNRLAKIHLSTGNPRKAVQHLEELLRIDPRSSEPHFLLAALYYASRDYRRSLEHALQSKELLPGNPDLRNLLGNLYFIQGDEEAARGEYRAAMQLAPGRSEFKANYEAVLE